MAVLVAALARAVPLGNDGAYIDAGDVRIGYNSLSMLQYHGGSQYDPGPSCNSDSSLHVRVDPSSLGAGCELFHPTALWAIGFHDGTTWRARGGHAWPVVLATAEPARAGAERIEVTNRLGDLQVRHTLERSPSPALVQVQVELENVGTTDLPSVHYRTFATNREMLHGAATWPGASTGEFAQMTYTRIFLDGLRPEAPSTLVCSSNGGPVGNQDLPCDAPDPETARTLPRGQVRCEDDGLVVEPPVVGPGFGGHGPVSGTTWASSSLRSGLVACGQGPLWEFDMGSLPAGSKRSFTLFLGGVLGDQEDALAELARPGVEAEFWSITEPGTDDPALVGSGILAVKGLYPPTPSLAWDADPPAWSTTAYVDGLTACAGMPVRFTGSNGFSSNPISAAAWSFGDGASAVVTPGPGAVDRTYGAPGSYLASLELEDVAGWARTATLAVTVVDCDVAPVATVLSVTSAGTCTDTQVHVVGSATDPDGGAGFTYAWDFGDGAQAVGPGASHQYTEDRLVVIRLTATDDDGRTATTTWPWSAKADFNCLPDLSVSTQVLRAPAGSTFRFLALATDLDDVPDLHLAEAPASAALATAPGAAGVQGAFEWSTQAGTPPGTYLVRVLATDGKASSSRTVDLVLHVLPRLAPDRDNDGVADVADNCAASANAPQDDEDADTLGDACDGTAAAAASTPAPAGAGDDGPADLDRDGVPDAADLCPVVPDPTQLDADGDGTGDACDVDADGDGVADNGARADNCPRIPNEDQGDADQDGLGDACDAVAMPLPAAASVQGHGTPRVRSVAPSAAAPPWPWLALAGALALVARWPGRWMWLLAFSRLRRESLLDHPVRAAIHELAAAWPGISLPDLALRTGRGRGTLQHHLRLLVGANLLREVGQGRITGYVQSSHSGRLANPPTLRERIEARLAAQPGAGVRELARELGCNPGTVSYHLRRIANERASRPQA